MIPRPGRVAVVLLAVTGCFTDYEVGDRTALGSSTHAGESSDATTLGDATADEGSDGTAGDGTAGDACEPAPAGGSRCPARCTGGCALGTCTIACEPRSACEGTDIVCPQGWPCVVLCAGQDACKQVTVHCSDGPCELQCTDAESCEGLVLECGTQSCNAWCSSEGDGIEAIDCGPSCACHSNCTTSDGSGSGKSESTDGGATD